MFDDLRWYKGLTIATALLAIALSTPYFVPQVKKWFEPKPIPTVEEVCIAYIQDIQTCQLELEKLKAIKKQASKKKK